MLKKNLKIILVVVLFIMLFTNVTFAVGYDTNANKMIINSNDCEIDSDGRYKYTFTVSEDGIYVFDDGCIVCYADGVNAGKVVSDASDSSVKGGIVLKAGQNYTTWFEPDELSDGKAKTISYEIVDSSTEATDNDEANIFEIIISWFILKMGQGLRGLISVIANEPLSIDALVFDRYNATALTFFTDDIGKFATGDNYILVSARSTMNFVFDLFRAIALAVYMIVLVYVGIRILLISTADKKARFKNFILDWVKGIAILFLFPYVIRYTILLNHALTTFIGDNASNIITSQTASIEPTAGGIGQAQNVPINTNKSDYMTKMYNDACSTMLISYALCWFVMLIQVVQFLYVYLKRLIKILFLITIFPLVTISYAIDKIGDGKSQAFDHWFKEFVLEVFVQSFHAINYVLVMGIICNFTSDNWFLKIIGITYIAKGGDIIRGLFAQMKGGGAGGPMAVSKALIKTKVAISAVKGLAKSTSRIVGAQSMMGRGVGKVFEGRNKYLEQKKLRTESQARKAIRNRNATIQYNQDGSLKVNVNITEEEINKNEDKLLSATATDKEKFEAANKLAEVNNLEDILNGKLNATQKGIVQSYVNNAIAMKVINAPKSYSNVQVQTAVQILYNDKTKNGSSFINKYASVNGITENNVMNKIRKASAAHSITIDEAARASRAPIVNYNDPKMNLKNSIHAIKSATDGCYNIPELYEHYNVVMSALASGDYDLKKIYEEETEDMTFDMKDFKLNLAVQTVNHSAEEIDQKYIDDAIKTIKNSKGDADKAAILENLQADIDGLQEGYLPHLITEESKIKEEFRKKLVDDPYSVDLGEEYDVYLEMKADEILSGARKDVAAGLAMTTVGKNVVAPLKLSLGMTSAGIAMGASTQGKEDIITEMATVVPGAFNVADNVTHKIGSLGASVGKTATKKFVNTKKAANLDVDRKSIKINKGRYANDAEERYVSDKISRAEEERQELLNRIKNIKP